MLHRAQTEPCMMLSSLKASTRNVVGRIRGSKRGNMKSGFGVGSFFFHIIQPAFNRLAGQIRFVAFVVQKKREQNRFRTALLSRIRPTYFKRLYFERLPYPAGRTPTQPTGTLCRRFAKTASTNLPCAHQPPVERGEDSLSQSRLCRVNSIPTTSKKIQDSNRQTKIAVCL